MKVLTITGSPLVNTTGLQRIGKSFGSLLIISSVHPKNLETEKISLFVETAKGNNIVVAKEGTKLKDFIALLTFGDAAIQKIGNDYYSRCELSKDGSYELGDDDVLKFEVSGIADTHKLDFHTMEYPEFSPAIAYIDSKVFTTDEKERTFQVEENEVVMLTNTDIITKVQMHWNGGITTDHDITELRAMALDVDQFATVGATVTAGLFDTNSLVLPVVKCRALSITKTSGICEILYLDTDYTNID